LLRILAKEEAKAPAEVPDLARVAYATTERRLTKEAAIAKQNPMVLDCREHLVKFKKDVLKKSERKEDC
jgi:hypothetical protein